MTYTYSKCTQRGVPLLCTHHLCPSLPPGHTLSCSAFSSRPPQPQHPVLFVRFMASIYFIRQERAEVSNTTPRTNSDAAQFVPRCNMHTTVIDIYIYVQKINIKKGYTAATQRLDAALFSKVAITSLHDSVSCTTGSPAYLLFKFL